MFYLTFPVRALRWRLLLNNAGDLMLPPLNRLIRIMVLGSFANSASVAQLGDVYRAYLLKEEAGVSLPRTLGTILAERLVDLVTLICLLAAAALTVYSGQLPQTGEEALVGGVAVSFAGMLGLSMVSRSRPLVERILPRRWHHAYDGFEHGAARSLCRLPLLMACSAVGWLIEGATLWLLGLAIGVNVSATGALGYWPGCLIAQRRADHVGRTRSRRTRDCARADESRCGRGRRELSRAPQPARQLRQLSRGGCNSVLRAATGTRG
jgi:uncharacterized membrane protein YbhN (UPF0104 family)